jgi:hypothetical protein
MTTATQTQIRRDTATNLNAATPAAGELGYDTTNKRITVGDGSTAGGTKIPNAADVQKQTFVYPTVGGTGDAITLTPSPALAAYADGVRFTFKAGAANTTAVTANVSALGAKSVKKMNNGALAALVANDIISGGIYEVIYDGTQFQIKALAEGPFSAGALKYLGTFTGSGVAQIDLTSAISSTYDDYQIVLEGLLPATNGADLWLRVSTDNGSTFDSGSNYAYANVKAASSGVSCDNNGGAGTTKNLVASGAGNSSNYGASGVAYYHNANGTGGQQKFVGNVSYFDSSGKAAGYQIAGVWTGTGPGNALRFLASSGNVSGTVKIYGIAKS